MVATTIHNYESVTRGIRGKMDGSNNAEHNKVVTEREKYCCGGVSDKKGLQPRRTDVSLMMTIISVFITSFGP